jgi:hypothetical protein
VYAAASLLITGSSLASAGTPTIASFSAGPDQTLTYPSDLSTLPDEHTTIIPLPVVNPALPQRYLFFASSSISQGNAGAVVLETTDLQNFHFARGYSSPVISPPVRFTLCNPTYDLEFDENYAAPGSVVQDPTRPLGDLIMLYEAENHCPGGVWQQPFYATVGFARSADWGKSWPPPVDSEFGGTQRHPVLKISTPEPTTPEMPPVALGNALPSAFVDTNARGESHVYVVYDLVGPGADGFLRVARALVDGEPRLRFHKWDNGAFSQPGIGGADSAALPAHGCVGFQTMGEISYNDDLGLYLMTYVCVSLQLVQGKLEPYQAAWYYATATNLAQQDWTTPQMIENTQFPVTQGCGIGGSGTSFDGWYPSTMSPGAAPGHTSLTGEVFFMNGCDTGLQRQFMSRTFTITTN